MISYDNFSFILNICYIVVIFGAALLDALYSIKLTVQHRLKNKRMFWQIFTRIISMGLMIFSFFRMWTKIITFLVSIITLFVPWITHVQYHSRKIHFPPVKQRKQQKKIYLGKLRSHLLPKKIFLPDDDIKRHMFITGLTGMGKSNLVKHLLNQLTITYPLVPFLLIEFKGEYNAIKNEIEPLTVRRPGESLKINIFNPRGEDPKIHAEKLMNQFISCQIITFQEEYSAQMEKLFVEILYAVCSDPKRRNWEGFDYYTEQIKKTQQSKYYNIHNTISSIENRIRRLKNGPLRTIFGEDINYDLDEIIHSNTIIDLSSIIQFGGTKNDAVFFSNVLFNHVWLYNLKRGPSSEINHFTFIEDSQFLLSQKVAGHLKASTYLEDFALLLRGTGECLVTINTRPTISEDVMANAGVIISFQIIYDQQLMGKLLSLKEKKVFYLTLLDVGECIIKTNSIPTPFMVKIPLLEFKSPCFE